MNTSEPAEAVRYADHIRPLFRQYDIDAMRRRLNLDSYDDVSAKADAVLDKLQAGDMPCDGAWPAEQVALFRKWIADGKQA